MRRLQGADRGRHQPHVHDLRQAGPFVGDGHRNVLFGGQAEPACRLHPSQGAIKTGQLTRWAVDLSPLEGLRLAAREDLRDRHTRHTEAVQKVHLPHPVGGQLKGARIAYGGQLCTR